MVKGFYNTARQMEEQGHSIIKIARKLKTDEPNIGSFYILLKETGWGENLMQAIFAEGYYDENLQVIE